MNTGHSQAQRRDQHWISTSFLSQDLIFKQTWTVPDLDFIIRRLIEQTFCL